MYGKYIHPKAMYRANKDDNRTYLQRHVYVSNFHIDDAGGGCMSPANLPGIKIWAVLPDK